jgi:hypothetical protein
MAHCRPGRVPLLVCSRRKLTRHPHPPLDRRTPPAGRVPAPTENAPAATLTRATRPASAATATRAITTCAVQCSRRTQLTMRLSSSGAGRTARYGQMPAPARTLLGRTSPRRAVHDRLLGCTHALSGRFRIPFTSPRARGAVPVGILLRGTGNRLLPRPLAAGKARHLNRRDSIPEHDGGRLAPTLGV